MTEWDVEGSNNCFFQGTKRNGGGEMKQKMIMIFHVDTYGIEPLSVNTEGRPALGHGQCIQSSAGAKSSP